jgi:hypothetical protein
MAIDVALLTCQQSWLDWPAEMTVGEAVNERICGVALPATVTVTGAVTDWPLGPLAVRV